LSVDRAEGGVNRRVCVEVELAAGSAVDRFNDARMCSRVFDDRGVDPVRDRIAERERVRR
jgi:hypothetical protein